jgi:putative drug exporter of the RND superfamily
MFQRLGELVSRAWPAFLVGWAILLGAFFWAAPPWQDVVLDREFAFLPDWTPSRRGEIAFEKAFPRQYNPSNFVLLLRRKDRELGKADFAFVERDLLPGLKEIQKQEGGRARPELDKAAGGSEDPESLDFDKNRPIIAAIHTFKEPGTGGLLISEDRKATLVIVELTSELLERRNEATLAHVDGLVGRLEREGKVPKGLEILQTGSAAVGSEVIGRQTHSAHMTEVTTVVVVIVLLLLIYRAPLIALVPLATVFLAVTVALKFLSLLAEARVLTLFEGIQTFITVIVYGSGVDYCLFLIARYKEELDGGKELHEAVANSLGKTGAAVTASAATVTAGIGMMTFANFGEFHFAGLAIASSLFISLCAVLTLTPPLLRLTGGLAFWPRRGKGGAGLGLPWDKVAAILQRRPGWIWLGTMALMLPFAVVAIDNNHNLQFDLVKRLPQDAVSIKGIEALKEHFPQGMVAPVIVLIRKPGVNFHEDRGARLIATFTDRLARLKRDLDIADVRSLAQPLGTSDAAQDAMDEIAIQMQLQKQKDPQGNYRRVEDYYVGENNVTQIQIVLSHNPMSRASVKQLSSLKSAVEANLPAALKGGEIEFLGLTEAIHDLQTVTYGDQWLIEALVVACVFVILLILLRRLVVSLYLIGSVVFSYLTTLGVTFALWWVLDPHTFAGLDWKVPIFLFTLLVAVGEDYNIFLMTRIHEEQEKHGPVDGVSVGLVRTGRIITSCGLIMAGTFSSLLTGTLVDLRQLGFALAFGVLLDTFVVRPILLPTFLFVLESGGFRSLRKLFRRGEKRAESPTSGREQTVAGGLQPR